MSTARPKKPKLDLREKLLLWGVFALFAHYLVIKYYDYPPLYCLLKPIGVQLFDAFSAMAITAAFLYILFAAVTLSLRRFMIGAMVYVIIAGLPTFADAILRVGASCN